MNFVNKAALMHFRLSNTVLLLQMIDERILKANLCRFPYRSVFGQPYSE